MLLAGYDGGASSGSDRRHLYAVLSRWFAITKKDTDGKTIFDETHLNWTGAYVFGRIVAAKMGNVLPGLKRYIRPRAAQLPKAFSVKPTLLRTENW